MERDFFCLARRCGHGMASDCIALHFGYHDEGKALSLCRNDQIEIDDSNCRTRYLTFILDLRISLDHTYKSFSAGCIFSWATLRQCSWNTTIREQLGTRPLFGFHADRTCSRKMLSCSRQRNQTKPSGLLAHRIALATDFCGLPGTH